MLFKEVLCIITGLSAGIVIAGGVFAFLIIIGAITRLVDKSHTAVHIHLYEDMLFLGGITGNIINLFLIGVWSPGWKNIFGIFILGAGGLSFGIFVGCLAMSLAETLKAFPVLFRRIKLERGLPWIMYSLAVGKVAGSLFFFIRHL